MSTVVSKDGTKIAYSKTGTGPALVLVDGAFCYRQNGTTPMTVPELSKHFTVYTYDRRGRGESTDTAPYAVEREIEDLEAVIGATGQHVNVLGMSSGAALALQAAERGVPMEKLVLFEPPYVDKADRPPADAAEQLARMVENGDRSGAVKYYHTTVMGMPEFAVLFVRLMPGVWKKNMSVAHTLPYDLAIMADFSVPAALAKSIKVPTLVLSGGKTSAAMQKAAQDTAAAIPAAHHQSINGMSHMLKAVLLVPVIKKFITEEK